MSSVFEKRQLLSRGRELYRETYRESKLSNLSNIYQKANSFSYTNTNRDRNTAEYDQDIIQKERMITSQLISEQERLARYNNRPCDLESEKLPTVIILLLLLILLLLIDVSMLYIMNVMTIIVISFTIFAFVDLYAIWSTSTKIPLLRWDVLSLIAFYFANDNASLDDAKYLQNV